MRKIFVYKNDNKCPVNDFLEKAEAKIKNKFEFCLEYLKDDKHCFCLNGVHRKSFRMAYNCCRNLGCEYI